MTAQRIFELEKRDGNNLYDIHFYMEGSFWKAYEWSAYLSRIFPSELNDEDRDINAAKNIKRFPLNPQSLVGL